MAAGVRPARSAHGSARARISPRLSRRRPRRLRSRPRSRTVERCTTCGFQRTRHGSSQLASSTAPALRSVAPRREAHSQSHTSRQPQANPRRRRGAGGSEAGDTCRGDGGGLVGSSRAGFSFRFVDRMRRCAGARTLDSRLRRAFGVPCRFPSLKFPGSGAGPGSSWACWSRVKASCVSLIVCGSVCAVIRVLAK